jgi:hypothetical protein
LQNAAYSRVSIVERFEIDDDGIRLA